jgi:uncharacterized integral membrane protein
MIRKFFMAIVLIPLAAVLIAFAVANRQTVTVSFDPFDPAQPAYAASLPLFILILVILIFGVLLGGIAVWLRQARWAWAARRAEKENRELRLALDRLKHEPPTARLPYPGAPATLRSPAE